ncbi:MAG TPA: N-formylglutamate amidohydrolase [Coriobacteriia bacterium]|nr:N-formylglutamate amidohydrolase [Coriobacteriia bacterium]
MSEPFDVRVGDGPIIALALHAGHALRPEVAARTALSDSDRLREEDPFTGEVARAVPTYIVVRRSRYEVDLNRARERAVYSDTADSWGLEPWIEPLSPDVAERSLAIHDAFYETLAQAVNVVLARHERAVVLDLHAYNHRRAGSEALPDDPAENPEVNLGTGWLDRERWRSVVEAFLGHMTAEGFDCRENVKFRGGYAARWLAERYPKRVCPLAIEFRKDFMDEWTGAVDERALGRIRAAVAALPDVLVSAMLLSRETAAATPSLRDTF